MPASDTTLSRLAARRERCGPSRSVRVPAWGEVTAASRKKKATAAPSPASPKPRSAPICRASAPGPKAGSIAAVCDDTDETSETTGRARSSPSPPRVGTTMAGRL